MCDLMAQEPGIWAALLFLTTLIGPVTCFFLKRGKEAGFPILVRFSASGK